MSEDPADRRSGGSQSSGFSETFSGRFARNTFFNFVGRFWAFFVTLLLTPYTLSRLGIDAFGVWVLLSVFANSFGLLDAGLGWSFIKFVAEYHAREDLTRINRVLFAGLAFYTLLGLVFLVLGGLVGPGLFAVFGVDIGLGVFLVLLGAFGMNNLAVLMLSMLRGLQRMDQSNTVEIAMSLPRIAGTVVFLEAGMGVRGLALNALLVAFLGTLLGWLRLRRAAPWIKLGWTPDLALMRDLLRYGWKLQVVRLSELVCFQVDRLIIARFLGMAPVSFYEVSSRLALFMRALPYVLISVMTPAVSELTALEDRERVLKIYRLATRYVAVITIGLVSLVTLEAESLLVLWLGPGFGESAIIVRVLAIGYGLNAMSAVAGQTGSGLGRPEFEMHGALLLTFLNPVLSIVLIQSLGVTGAALGTSVALGVGAVYVVEVFQRSYVGDSGASIFLQAYWRVILAGLAGSGCVWVLDASLPGLAILDQTRIEALMRIGTVMPLFLIAYLGCLIAFRHLKTADWERALRIGKAFRQARWIKEPRSSPSRFRVDN